jgi:hypothetical protein
MGYYIQTEKNRNKAQQICDAHPEAFIIPQPVSFDKVPENMGLIVIVDNVLFEAAGYCYNEREFLDFQQTARDTRPRTWLLMDKEKAEKLSGYK